MARVGKRWTTEEDELLKEEVKNKMNYEEIAENHKRNIGGIKSRVISNIILPLIKNSSYYNDTNDTNKKEIDIKKLEEEYGIREVLLRKYLELPTATSVKLEEENLLLNELKSLKLEIIDLKKSIEELKEKPVILYVF